jgi:hypothetical protein
MLQEVYALLISRHLTPRWVKNELHVEVCGLPFMLADHPAGVAVLKRPKAQPDEDIFAYVCAEPAGAMAALGL